MDIDLPFTADQLILHHRYEVVSILNDLLIAVWFIIGSVLFFSPSTTYAATWLFLLGSVQLAVRPLIRLTRQVHLRRSGAAQAAGHGAAGDF